MKKKILFGLGGAVLITGAIFLVQPVTAYIAAGNNANNLTFEESAFVDEVGLGEYVFSIDDRLSTDFGTVDMPLGEAWRPAGSDAEHEAAAYIRDEMQSIGLQNVAMEGFPVHGYTFGGASVQVMTPTPGEVMLAAGHGGIPGTPTEGITAPIVYVGIGAEANYEGVDVTGKLVLVDVDENELNWLHMPHYEAELHGAAGLIVHWVGYQLAEGSITTMDSISRPTIPAVSVSHTDFAALKDLAETSGGTATVTMKSDATIDEDATSYNVAGYIPGLTNPNKLIIIGAHYDKWWYGAADDSGGVAQMLAIAKAMVDSGYQPSKTIVFVAHGAEEFGWTDTNFDWCIGSSATIKTIHPDWPGRSLAFFNLDNGAGLEGADTILAEGTPETNSFRESVLPVLDKFFKKTAPWSDYYAGSEAYYNLPTTWADEFSFGSAGIPTMSIVNGNKGFDENERYHTQMDDMNIMSAESLAMATIANGVSVIRLDRALLAQYDFTAWADDITAHVKPALIRNEGLDPRPLNVAIRNFKNEAEVVRDLMEESSNPANKHAINALLLETQKTIATTMVTVGGYDEVLYPHEQYQNDATALRKAIETLEAGNGNKALKKLLNVYGMYEGVQLARPVYRELVINRHRPDRTDLFWAEGRLARFVNLYDEYYEIVNGEEESALESLRVKHATTVSRLQESLDAMTSALVSATENLEEIEGLLQ